MHAATHVFSEMFMMHCFCMKNMVTEMIYVDIYTVHQNQSETTSKADFVLSRARCLQLPSFSQNNNS